MLTMFPPSSSSLHPAAPPPSLTYSRAHTCMHREFRKALPVVPQVHCAFLDLAEHFKAALQLRPGAVGPQPPHVHHPSLLLLVKEGTQREGLEGCFFSLPPFSFRPNESVPITPVSDSFPRPSVAFARDRRRLAVASYLMEFFGKGASGLPRRYNPSFSPRLINRRETDVYQMMQCLHFGATSSFFSKSKNKKRGGDSAIHQPVYLLHPTKRNQLTGSCSHPKERDGAVRALRSGPTGPQKLRFH